MRATLFCLALFATTLSLTTVRLTANCHATDELRWSFDSLPPESLAGNATVESIGPTAQHFEGLPESNAALRLDGKGAYVRVLDNHDHGSLDFRQGDPITIEAWVRLDRIKAGQNVYLVGKGRTYKKGSRDNQNYALRLRGVGREGRLSFLFRSEESETEKSDWHRWNSRRGFRADGHWHHVAISYKFGQPESIRGYVDGDKVTGTWDMGGPTKRPPVVDDDDLWIGSSMGGAAGSSFSGAIDELIIARTITKADVFAKRRIVRMRAPEAPPGGIVPGTVSVALYENVGSESVWPLSLPKPFVDYTQPSMGFSRIPRAFGRGGVRRDWKGPLLLTAMAEFNLPDGDGQWMLRAGGLSRLWIDGKIVAETDAHLGATSGHGKVVHYEQQDPWLRPPHPGHFETIVSHTRSNTGPVKVILESMVGGEGLRYEPGEIMVAFRADPSDPWQVLSHSDRVTVTDQSWVRYARSLEPMIQQIDDRLRRQVASVDDNDWHSRHDDARRYIASLPAIELPAVVEGDANANPIDRFLNERLSKSGLLDQIGDPLEDRPFLRRLFLDCVGVVPTTAELQTLNSYSDDTKNSRKQWIKKVLQDDRWADHWTAYWMDVLAENPSVLKPTLNNSGPFRWYLYDMMRDNVAIDRWVTGLLRMEGSLLAGGPAGFAMAAENDVPMAAKAHIATSAFLGVNMKCARCHDAPYHDWTQKDLFSIAAMLEQKPIKIPASSSVPQAFFAGEEEGNSLIVLSLAPGDEVAANWSLASHTETPPVDRQTLSRPNDSRDELAYQITRPENHQFAKTIVNRVWQRLMGEGIVEPVDDWEGADPSHPRLLDFLARELATHDFDVKHVAALILESDAYQRRSVDRPITRDETERTFASPRMRRMTAEQLVDSMHVVVGRPMQVDELTFDPEARMKSNVHGNLGSPTRAWQLASLSNERDRPALSLPRAAAVTDCLLAFGWKGSRQEPINHRQTDPNVIQPGMLSGGLLSIQLTRLTDDDELTTRAIHAESVDDLVTHLFQRFLTRSPNAVERQRFVDLLSEGFEQRVLSTPLLAETPIREPSVSWANHLHPEASEVRMRQSARLRQGPPASRRLETEWRQRLEDAVWSLLNTPEFLFIQ